MALLGDEALADLRDVITGMVGECARYAEAGTGSGIVIAGMAHASIRTYSHGEVAQLLAMAVTMLGEHEAVGPS